MRKPRDNLPLFNLTTAIRKFYSREETQDSFPAIEFESSREDSDAAFLRHYTRYTRLSRFTAALILILATVMLVIVGGVVFWFIERKVVLKNCKDIVQSKQGYTNIRAVNSMTEYVEIIEAYERCSEEKQDTTKIESIMQGIGFAWSIVTTIGYGHHFPHTILGKLLTVVFAIFSIPLYVSVKAELGNYISLFIWKITMHTHRLVGKICKKITPFEAADWEIVLMASFFTVIFLCIFSTLTLLVESWTFGLSVWFTVQTILLIGVGDAEPHNQYFFLYFGVPITVIGDIISSHIIYYLHGRYRICAHMVSRCICGCTEPDSDISKKFMNDRQQKIQVT
ncbi:hypothetical protein WR25_09561 [Diploscapter pachys]|uniref:Potassium channel domain-containing protein n=1 Tax=Diploscapter pachys TaxID=2018661 RepID=A0A2A2KX77_9BILA|nr:hypothetical protein WR25_09561 [Diploscapter pachys]